MASWDPSSLPALPKREIPRSPKTPQAQIVKNNFKASSRVVSGRKQTRSKLSFISPEIIRDNKHGLFTHFEERKASVVEEAVRPPSTSPKKGDCFVRSVSHQPSPAMRVRRLRVLRTKNQVQDKNAKAYYETPRRRMPGGVMRPSPPPEPSPMREGLPLRPVGAKADQVGFRSAEEAGSCGANDENASASQSAESKSSRMRREVRSKLSFPVGAEDIASHPCQEQEEGAEGAAEGAAAADPSSRDAGGGAQGVGEDLKLVSKMSPVSVMDPPTIGSLACELCGQKVNEEALTTICSRAITYLQSRGRYVSSSVAISAGVSPVAVQSLLEMEDSEITGEGGSAPAASQCQTTPAVRKSVQRLRNRTQKKVWRSIGESRGSSLTPASEFLKRSTRSYTTPSSMLQHDFAKKLERQRNDYTPVKNLIYSPVSRNATTCLDVNAATFLFASQMKLTLSGDR
ncbi:hypothetical protein HOP50_16g77130 [Chloropicon primus]|uniref:Uncharacterized protein n=1 Tax=Chloropicon primus TaxID=1764295 RepID=A0A5B8MXC2_9CHLO|nr:hypothetical protein A3770_16p76850 [Chloropicon primus]UPR04372.1 hypothetical protein HOP50_16g77130 [Chloropicon primus]|eukprot:QDZ25167.1 hypothetical protein A3770_16p76850 [Chloropicon primus]